MHVQTIRYVDSYEAWCQSLPTWHLTAILNLKIALYSQYSCSGIGIQLTCTITWQVNQMLLFLLLADHYCLHNNIVIMCVMYKQTRNRDNETECDEEWTRKWQHTFSYCTLSPHDPRHLQRYVHCKFNARHLNWRMQPFLHPQCTRS